MTRNMKTFKYRYSFMICPGLVTNSTITIDLGLVTTPKLVQCMRVFVWVFCLFVIWFGFLNFLDFFFKVLVYLPSGRLEIDNECNPL